MIKIEEIKISFENVHERAKIIALLKNMDLHFSAYQKEITTFPHFHSQIDKIMKINLD